MDALLVRTRAWLASELSDWGAGDDELLTQALTTLATRFIDEDPQLLAPVDTGAR
jgi:hypothetical protein